MLFDQRQLTTSKFFHFGVNLIPLAGVLIWDWQIVTVLAAYFIETLVVGLYTIVRMFTLSILHNKNNDYNGFATIGLIPFFIVHYGFFIFVQLGILTAILGDLAGVEMLKNATSMWDGNRKFLGAAFYDEGYIFVAGLLVSHGLFLIQNFFLNDEYKEANAMVEMFRPYGRILVQQLLVIVGGFVIMIVQHPLPFLILLILLKTFIDQFYAEKFEMAIKENAEKAGIQKPSANTEN